MRRKIFQWFTVFLLVVSVWTAYANVLSDDAPVRAMARSTVNQAAGCGDDCRLEGMRGERGMLEERIEYDVVGRGHFAVACRRAFIIAGDYSCVVTEGTVKIPASSTSGSPSASASGSRR